MIGSYQTWTTWPRQQAIKPSNFNKITMTRSHQTWRKSEWYEITKLNKIITQQLITNRQIASKITITCFKAASYQYTKLQNFNKITMTEWQEVIKLNKSQLKIGYHKSTNSLLPLQEVIELNSFMNHNWHVITKGQRHKQSKKSPWY